MVHRQNSDQYRRNGVLSGVVLLVCLTGHKETELESCRGGFLLLALLENYHDVEAQRRAAQPVSDPSDESHLARFSVQQETPAVVS